MSSEKPAKGGSRALRIGKYEIISHIATGGMGAVYKARDTDLNRDVALKVLPPELAARPGMLQRFQREARHAAKLRHENVVAIYEIGEAGGTSFLALEFVDGIDLAKYIERKGKLDPDEALGFLTQAARALVQMHKQNLVHRDIKPSNFLITKKDRRTIVKLTDLGLAREVDDNEFKVTKAGTTVGTVDYMAPEQARNSRAADIRSDIYSLGCTFYHMLAGRPPFAEGGLTERLYKHVTEEPEDICRLNRKVPAGMAAVLRRMLEKNAANRYQTPAELLKDVERLKGSGGTKETDPQRDLLASLASEKPADSSVRRPSVSRTTNTEIDVPAGPRWRGAKRYRSGDYRRLDADQASALVGTRPWWPYAAVVGGILIVVLIAVVLAVRQNRQPANLDLSIARTSVGYVRNEERDVEPVEPKGSDAKGPTEPAKADTTPRTMQPRPAPKTEAPRPPALYQPSKPLALAELLKEIEGPWAGAAALRTGTGPVLHVSRVPRGGSAYPSLAAACAAAKPGEETIIEIDDNGPLFESAVTVAGRSLVVRGGKGYRPLLAWAHEDKKGSENTTFLTVTGGDLRLQDLDIVTRGFDTGPLTLVRVSGGDFEAWGCTFSVARKRRDGDAVLRLEGTKPEGIRCRFSRCYLRGADLTALDLSAPAAQVLFDDSLVVGGAAPLLDHRGRGGKPAVLRFLRSTFVGRQTFLRVRPDSAGETNPAIHLLGLDTLLARSSGEVGGAMIVLERCGKEAMRWQAVNCLYTGWQTLLTTAGGRVAFDQLALWHSLWDRKEGDRAAGTTWPEIVHADPSEASKEEYRPAGRAWFAAVSAGDRAPLGCNVAGLPPGRDPWLPLTFDRVTFPPYDLPTDQTPPIPNGGTDYEGERLDLGTTRLDLGERLREVEQTRPLGARIVLHLTGSGRIPTSPIALRGTTLVLYFEPPAEGAAPLELVPKEDSAGERDALIEVQEGSLEITNGAFHLLNQKFAPLPKYLLRVRGGDLRLYGCRLTGPLGNMPAWYQGLVWFGGSGKPEPGRARELASVNTVMASGRSCVTVAGVGARLRLHNSVLIAGGDALRLDPGPAPDKWKPLLALLPAWCPAFSTELKIPPRSRLNVQCLLENNTFAVGGAVVALGDAPDLAGATVDPYWIRARANVVLDPYASTTHRAGLVRFERDALPRGLLVWQGADNAFDKGLYYHIAEADAVLAQPFAAWAQVWGPFGEVNSLPFDMTAAERKLDLNFPNLDLLAPASLRNKARTPPPGSDLVKPGTPAKK